MAIELDKGRLTINQVIANEKEAIGVSGDCIVPDVKPDILEIVGTSGIVNVYKKEVMDGKVRIDGCVNVYVMYLGEENGVRGVRSINHTLDFSQIFNIGDANPDMSESGEIFLQGIDCKVINERKINLKANLVFEIKLLANSNIEFVNNVNVKDVQKLEKTINVNSVLGIGSTKAIAKETVNIDVADNLAEILRVNADICNKNVKVSYNKILTKADIRVKILYTTEDGRINTVSSRFPIMGFIDMQDITEENVCDYEFEIKNMIIKPNGAAEHSVYVEIGVGINVTAYENKEINMIEDLYCPCSSLSFEQKNIMAMKNKNRFTGTLSINQREVLGIGDEKIYDVDVRVLPNHIHINDNEVIVSGNVNLTFIHSVAGTLSNLQTKQIEIPFENRISAPGVSKNSNVEITSNVLSEDFNIMPGGEVGINLEIEFNVSSSEDVNVNLINNVEEVESEASDDYNMIIYTVLPNDSLWKIAKKFRSTVASIMETNELKSDLIMPGNKLFIEKYMG